MARCDIGCYITMLVWCYIALMHVMNCRHCSGPRSCCASAPIYACMDLFITALHPPSAPVGSSGSYSRQQWQLRLQPASAACAGRSQNAEAHDSEQPSCSIHQKEVCSRWREKGRNFSCPSLSSRSMYLLNLSLAIVLSFMFLASVIS